MNFRGILKHILYVSFLLWEYPFQNYSNNNQCENINNIINKIYDEN